jgi:flagellin
MAISDISLTGSMRAVLVSLQDTQSKIDRTSERLATGKKVNSPLDNPANFFAAEAHRSRAGQLNARKDGIAEAIQTIKQANAAVTAITSLIETARGIATSARSDLANTNLEAQYDAIIADIDAIVGNGDSAYKGINLLEDGVTLAVNLNEDATSTLTLTAFDATSANATAPISAADFTDQSTIDAAEAELDAYLDYLRENSAILSSNLGILTTRESFITNTVNNLTEGANKLTLADLNEEGANLTLLQTQQGLSVTSLSIAAQSAQSVLRLF